MEEDHIIQLITQAMQTYENAAEDQRASILFEICYLRVLFEKESGHTILDSATVNTEQKSKALLELYEAAQRFLKQDEIKACGVLIFCGAIDNDLQQSAEGQILQKKCAFALAAAQEDITMVDSIGAVMGHA